MRSDRLLVLAAHLKSDRRGHKEFDLAVMTSGPRNEARHGCGTVGCAFGELPVVWSEAWKFIPGLFSNCGGQKYSVGLKSPQRWGRGDAFDGSVEFFELDNNEVRALFYADYELQEPSPIEPLPRDATAEQVADRFIAFVKWREEQAEHLETGKGENDAITEK